MRVVHLEAENVKRVRAVAIDADRHVNIIGGANGQGKTSVLDALYWALAGASAAKGQPVPVRAGEESAVVTVDLGDLIVTRHWDADGATRLSVKPRDGVQVKSPQAMLDALVGRMTFDPLAFARMTARERRETLLAFIDLAFDLSALEDHRAAVFEERTACNRDLRTAQARLSEMSRPPAIPDNPPSVADAVEAFRALQAVKSRHDQIRDSRIALDRTIGDALLDHHAAERRLTAARDALTAAVGDSMRAKAKVDELNADAAALDVTIAALDDPDMDDAAQAVIEAEAVAGLGVSHERWNELNEHVEAFKAQAESLTAQLAYMDSEKTAGLAATVMPVPGLSFDDDGVTFGGLPFSQCSAAEQLRISVGIAMAMNPDLRILRITDGSLLDDTSMELLRGMMVDHDFQLWIERVGDGDEIAVIIEDGAVRGNHP